MAMTHIIGSPAMVQLVLFHRAVYKAYLSAHRQPWQYVFPVISLGQHYRYFQGWILLEQQGGKKHAMPRRIVVRLRSEKGGLSPGRLFPFPSSIYLGQPCKTISHHRIAAGQSAIIGFFWPGDQFPILRAIQKISASVSVAELPHPLPADLPGPVKITRLCRHFVQIDERRRIKSIIIQKA